METFRHTKNFNSNLKIKIKLSIPICIPGWRGCIIIGYRITFLTFALLSVITYIQHSTPTEKFMFQIKIWAFFPVWGNPFCQGWSVHWYRQWETNPLSGTHARATTVQTHMQGLGNAGHVGLGPLLVLEPEGGGAEVLYLLKHPLLGPFYLEHLQILKKHYYESHQLFD